ncbi:MAG: AhpC/TSA family protein [Acidimicrobiia bacterium]|nr:AhpC/TSA family protein [Acidimicrobiia bacterium]
MTLAEELEAFAAKGRATHDAHRKAVYARAAEWLADTDILERALGAGDRAPMFELPDAFGNRVKLADVLESGPAIVSFYRGSWCPFCNMELRALQRELESVEEAGATLVAISPNRPDVSLETIEKHELTFPVLSDHENRVARQFNLVHEVEPGMVAYYRGIDRNIDEMNGSDAWELPVPATYVIDQSGVVRYAFVDLNHRVRAEPAEVVAAAAALRS